MFSKEIACTHRGSPAAGIPKHLIVGLGLVFATSITSIHAFAQNTERTGKQIVEARCAKCHETGTGGAPRIGDRDAWIPRLKGGFDLVVRSAINGHGGMPARGGMANLTDAEMRNAITYMFNKGRVPPK